MIGINQLPISPLLIRQFQKDTMDSCLRSISKWMIWLSMLWQFHSLPVAVLVFSCFDSVAFVKLIIVMKCCCWCQADEKNDLSGTGRYLDKSFFRMIFHEEISFLTIISSHQQKHSNHCSHEKISLSKNCVYLEGIFKRYKIN